MQAIRGYDHQLSFEWERLTEKMVGFLRRALTSPLARERRACSPGERELGKMIRDEWQLDGHAVTEEPYSCAPTAFLGFFPLLGVLYVACVFLIGVDSYFYSFILSSVGLLLVLTELLFYWKIIDFLFPKVCLNDLLVFVLELRT